MFKTDVFSSQTSKKDSLINGTYRLPCMSIVLLVAAAKMPLEEAALVAGI
jgi:hypothetical protein